MISSSPISPCLFCNELVKDIIGESDANNVTTNNRIREAGELSESEFVRAMFNLRDIPITDSTEDERELVNFGAAAYFYFLENADDLLLTKYTEKINRHIQERFGRPKMRTRGAF